MKMNNLTSIVVVLILLLTTVSFIGVRNEQDNVIGNWILPDGIELEIFKNKNTYQGRIAKLHDFNNGQTKDIHNPDKLKKQDSLVGKIIMQNLTYDVNKGKWINGEIYNPGRGIIANLEIVEVNTDLKVYFKNAS